MANVFDKTIEYFSPQAAARRESARMLLKQLRNFDGAAKGDRYGGWKRGGGSANSVLAGSRQAMVNNARDFGRNNPYAVSAVRAAVNATIGHGITAQFRYSKGNKKKAQKEVNNIWWYWAHTTDCDFYGRNTLAGLQRLAFKTERASGEVIVRRVRRKSAEGTIPFQIQVLEADYLDDTKDTDFTDGGRIVQGIPYDSKDRRVGYWLHEEHPGEAGRIKGFGKSFFVPAADIIHMFDEQRPGQARGYPSAAPVVTRLKDFDDYEDAQLVRQKVAACWAAFIHDSEPLSRMGANDLPPGVQPSTTDSGYAIESMQPGLIERLPPGKSITFGSPPGVSNDGYSRGVLLAIAAGYGVTYEAMTGDYTNVNFSSGRMGWIAFYKNVQHWFYLMFKPQMLDKVVGWFEESLFLRGYDIENLECKWTPPRRTMLDPQVETKADKEAVRAGFKSVREVIAENGGDYEETFAAWKADAALMDEMGLTFDTDPRKVSNSGQIQQATNAPASETPPAEKDPDKMGNE